MTGVLISKTGKKLIQPKKFRIFGENENELENLLIDNPELLIRSYESPVKVVKNQVLISKKKKVDILLCDSTGLPILVEVKLHDNKESEREVVGQIFDYASSLNLMDYADLIDKVQNNLEKVLRSFSKTELEFNQLKARFENRLKEGNYRLIIAVDTAPNDLIKTWLYANAHSKSLDIRLITVQRYELEDGSIMITPYHLVSNEFYLNLLTNASHPILEEIAQEFDNYNIPGIMRNKTIIHDKCEIFVTGWPKKVNYEFTYWSDENYIAVEIMAELKSFEQIASDIILFRDKLQKVFPNTVDLKNGGNYKGWIRLQIHFSPDSDIIEIANAMKTLIDLTKDQIAKSLTEKKLM